MSECTSWHAVAYVGHEWAERRAQWAGTTSGRPPVIGLHRELRPQRKWSAR